jgi:hypothetical protein
MRPPSQPSKVIALIPVLGLDMADDRLDVVAGELNWRCMRKLEAKL